MWGHGWAVSPSKWHRVTQEGWCGRCVARKRVDYYLLQPFFQYVFLCVCGGQGEIILFYFNWRLITLQYCGGFCHTFTWISHGCTCVPHPDPPSPSQPSGSSQCTRPEHPVSCIKHGLVIYFTYDIIYMFQCYSLKSSHPRLLPQSPKVCSLHLCLFCCLAYRGIVTIFLNSVYVH